MTDPRSDRLLVLAPFPPRLDALHGGGQALARLLQMHAELRRVVLLALRRPDERGVDEAVAAACEAVHEVERVPIGRSPRLAWRERGRVEAAVRGWPLWATSVATRAFEERLDAICAEWRPHVVQAEFGVTGPYLRRVKPPAVRVLVEHDPGARRAGGWIASWSWRRFARTAAAAADAIVVFTEGGSRGPDPQRLLLEQSSSASHCRGTSGRPPSNRRLSPRPRRCCSSAASTTDRTSDATRRLLRLLPELRPAESGDRPGARRRRRARGFRARRRPRAGESRRSRSVARECPRRRRAA